MGRKITRSKRNKNASHKYRRHSAKQPSAHTQQGPKMFKESSDICDNIQYTFETGLENQESGLYEAMIHVGAIEKVHNFGEDCKNIFRGNQMPREELKATNRPSRADGDIHSCVGNRLPKVPSDSLSVEGHRFRGFESEKE